MNKKLLALLWVYSIWVFSAMMYNKKDPKELSKDLCDNNKSLEDKSKVFLNNFIEIHQNLLNDLKARLLTEENKQKFSEIMDEYKQKGQEIVSEVKEKWQDYLQEWLQNLEEFTNNQISKIKKSNTKDNIEELKEELIQAYNDFKDKLKKL